MKYIAHAGVKLKDGVTHFANYEWNYIKTIDGIEYRWRLGKDRTYEVVAGLFDDKSDALISAKTMYITLLYSLLKGRFSLANAGCSTYEPRFFNKERDVDYDSFQRTESFFFGINTCLVVCMALVYMKSKTLLTNLKNTNFWGSNYLFHITLI